MAEIVDDVKIRLDMSETDKVIALAEDNATMKQVLFQLFFAIKEGKDPCIVLNAFNDNTFEDVVTLICDNLKKKGVVK